MATGALHQAQYDTDAADFFDLFEMRTRRNRLYFELVRQIVAEAGLAPPAVAVDFGCGTGRMVRELAGWVSGSVTGVDTSAAMLDRAIKLTVQADLDNGLIRYEPVLLPALTGRCDLITAVHMHYHFPTEADLHAGFFGPIARLLSARGLLVVFTVPRDLTTPPWHYRLFMRDGTPDFHPVTAERVARLRDGDEVRSQLRTVDKAHRIRTIDLTDTYWTEAALARMAGRSKLDLARAVDVGWPHFPYPAYRCLVFRPG